MATDSEIIAAINAREGHRKAAAKSLGVSQSTIHRAIRRFGPDKVKPPWRGNKRPLKGSRPSKKDVDCKQKVPVHALVRGLHELRETGMDHETILRRVEMLLLAMASDPDLAIEWTPDRLAERQEQLGNGFPE